MAKNHLRSQFLKNRLIKIEGNIMGVGGRRDQQDARDIDS